MGVRLQQTAVVSPYVYDGGTRSELPQPEGRQGHPGKVSLNWPPPSP